MEGALVIHVILNNAWLKVGGNALLLPKYLSLYMTIFTQTVLRLTATTLCTENKWERRQTFENCFLFTLKHYLSFSFTHSRPSV